MHYKLNQTPNEAIFRAYDIRGIVDDGIDAEYNLFDWSGDWQ